MVNTNRDNTVSLYSLEEAENILKSRKLYNKVYRRIKKILKTIIVKVIYILHKPNLKYFFFQKSVGLAMMIISILMCFMDDAEIISIFMMFIFGCYALLSNNKIFK